MPLVLVEAELVPRIVAKQGLDTVGPLGRLLQEGNALTFQVLVDAPDVIGFDYAGPHHARGYQAEKRRGVPLAEHLRLGAGEGVGEVAEGLLAHPGPAEARPRRVSRTLRA